MSTVSNLIQCPSCAHSVSKTALNCPSCGAVLRKRRRSLFGKIVITAFWLFNVLMVLSVWKGTSSSLADLHSQPMSPAETLGAQIGTGIGIITLVVIWVFGDIILGLMALLTRPR